VRLKGTAYRKLFPFLLMKCGGVGEKDLLKMRNMICLIKFLVFFIPKLISNSASRYKFLGQDSLSPID
jgi:hypothetical protein